ncbi:Dihydrodipicolinate synthetase [Candidatus Sulfopaludibacter sp. SbA3]|nr:Dihydrodipicolinate synthetase [Candidatus Sulfopaludibacter sp. SbA3]
MIEIQGVYAAAITPRSQHGELDFGAAFELIDFLCKGGVNGIALCSEVGEFAALSTEERSRLALLAVKRSRVPVLVGVGSASLEGSLTLAREARRAGAAGLLLPPPHFFSYDQDDLREFYLQFAAQLGGGVPVFLARLPAPCTQLHTSTVLDLLSTGRFAGVEETGDGDSVLHLRAERQGQPWRILASEDVTLVAARRAGAHGAISAAACAVPELVTALDCAIRSQNQLAVEQLEAMLQEFLLWVNQFPQPAVLKVATGLRSLKTGPLAVPLSPEKQRRMDQFRAWFSAWLPGAKKLTANG